MSEIEKLAQEYESNIARGEEYRYDYDARNGNIEARLYVALNWLENPNYAQKKEKGVVWLKGIMVKGGEIGEVASFLLQKHGIDINDLSDYKEAEKHIRDLRKAAKNGDAEAQCELGACYYNGGEVKQNSKTAMEWFEKAADQENAKAQYWLGECFSHSKDVYADPYIQFPDGTIYDDDEFVFEKILGCYRQALSNGSADAAYSIATTLLLSDSLASCFEIGDSEQFYLCNKAAEQGHEKAQEWIDKYFANEYNLFRRFNLQRFIVHKDKDGEREKDALKSVLEKMSTSNVSISKNYNINCFSDDAVSFLPLEDVEDIGWERVEGNAYAYNIYLCGHAWSDKITGKLGTKDAAERKYIKFYIPQDYNDRKVYEGLAKQAGDKPSDKGKPIGNKEIEQIVLNCVKHYPGILPSDIKDIIVTKRKRIDEIIDKLIESNVITAKPYKKTKELYLVEKK